jgi:hypothetical protein
LRHRRFVHHIAEGGSLGGRPSDIVIFERRAKDNAA